MKVLGIVVEYNPFHNGHLYHLEKSREITGADCVVAVMSGNFTQRGEPSVVDKWARAKMALAGGVDLVIELPFAYASASAEFFAYGAVKALDSLGLVDFICFGSESGDLGLLSEAAAIFADEPEDYRQALKLSLSGGKSFPAARQEALAKYLACRGNNGKLSSVLPQILENSNNILGIEYLKALKKLKSQIKPFTIGRVGSGYNSATLTGKFSSATAIRNIIAGSTWHEAKQLLAQTLPKHTISILDDEFGLGRGPVFSEDFSSIILSLLRRMTADEIGALPYMERGLESRIRKAAENSGTLGELLDAVYTRRYTCTRIRRILFCLLAGLSSRSFEALNLGGGLPYIRILGFNDVGRKLLSASKETASLPIITKTADFKNSENPSIAAMLRLEASATDQYVLAFKNSEYRKSGSEYTKNVILHNI